LCGESGHFCRECPRNQWMSKPKHKTKPATTQSERSHVDLECDTDEGAFGASTKPGDSKGWIVDSGVSSYMLPVRKILVNYVEFENPKWYVLGMAKWLRP